MPDAASEEASAALEAVQPKSEGKRVYNNCIALCIDKPGLSITCPDGAKVSVLEAKRCGKSWQNATLRGADRI